MLTDVRPPNGEFSWALNDVKRRIRSIRRALDLPPLPDDPRIVRDLSIIASVLERFLAEIEEPLGNFTKRFKVEGSEPVMSSGCDGCEG